MDAETIEACAQVCDEYEKRVHLLHPVDMCGIAAQILSNAAMAQIRTARQIAREIRALADVLPCGHPRSAIAGDGMTHWCAMCEAEAQDDADTEAALGWAGAGVTREALDAQDDE